MMDLKPQQFPLRAVGMNIFGKMQDCPMFVAVTPELAAEVVEMLNEIAAIRATVIEDWPIAVERPDYLK